MGMSDYWLAEPSWASMASACCVVEPCSDSFFNDLGAASSRLGFLATPCIRKGLVKPGPLVHTARVRVVAKRVLAAWAVLLSFIFLDCFSL